MIITSAPDLFGRTQVVGYGDSSFHVEIITKGRADRFIKRYHYSGAVVWSSHIGVFSFGALVGVLQFGPAMNPRSGYRIVAGAMPHSWVELNRMAFTPDRPKDTGSRALSFALRVMRHRRPEVEWVQSFADERCGKYGAVYQAASFLYCGSHTGRFFELDGQWFHQSALNRPVRDKRGWGIGPKLTWFRQHSARAVPREFRQFRYIKCLTRRARKNLLLPVLPYPKANRNCVDDVVLPMCSEATA